MNNSNTKLLTALAAACVFFGPSLAVAQTSQQLYAAQLQQNNLTQQQGQMLGQSSYTINTLQQQSAYANALAQQQQQQQQQQPQANTMLRIWGDSSSLERDAEAAAAQQGR
jgi:hypothetical protein